MSEYEKQATDFLKKTNTTMEVEYLKNGKHFNDDKETRDIYTVKFKRGNRSFKVEFGQSIAHSSTESTRDLEDQIASIKKERKSGYGLFQPHLRELKKELEIQAREIKVPNAYDVLACLQKYEVGTLEDFCNEYGYDMDSKSAEKIYNAVLKEWGHVQALWTDSEIEELAEIQ